MDAKILMQNLLLSENWNRSNLIFARYFKSNDASILIGYLMDKDNYFQKNNQDYNGWFFHTIEQVEEATSISEKKQRLLIEKFEKLKLIDVKKKKGVPPKRHFKINYGTLQVLFGVKSDETSLSKVTKRHFQKLRNVTYNYLTKDNLNKVIKENSNEFSFEQNKNSGIIEDFETEINKVSLSNNKRHKAARLNKDKQPKMKYITPEQFKEFWSMYPKKAGKSQAISSWEKICLLPINKGLVTRPKWKEIKASIQEHQKSERWQKQIDKIPNASTWLNQHRWLNEDVANEKIIVDFNAPKRNNTTGYRGGYEVTTEYIQM